MKECPKCGEKYQDVADTCSKCNTSLDAIVPPEERLVSKNEDETKEPFRKGRFPFLRMMGKGCIIVGVLIIVVSIIVGIANDAFLPIFLVGVAIAIAWIILGEIIQLFLHMQKALEQIEENTRE